MNAGEQRHFTVNTIEAVQTAIDNSSLWEQGMLLAQDMPLGQLVAELARYRHGRLRCDPAIAQQPVSGAFPVRDTDASLDMLANTLPVTIHYLTPWWVTLKAR